jgi:hypothetical protein
MTSPSWSAVLSEILTLHPPGRDPAVVAAAEKRRHDDCLARLKQNDAYKTYRALCRKVEAAEKELAGGEADVRKASRARRDLLGRLEGGADVAALLGALNVADGVAQGRKDALVAGLALLRSERARAWRELEAEAVREGEGWREETQRAEPARRKELAAEAVAALEAAGLLGRMTAFLSDFVLSMEPVTRRGLPGQSLPAPWLAAVLGPGPEEPAPRPTPEDAALLVAAR